MGALSTPPFCHGYAFAKTAPAELEPLIQELQVHRVELEVQNRALRDSIHQTEAAVRRYAVESIGAGA